MEKTLGLLKTVEQNVVNVAETLENVFDRLNKKVITISGTLEKLSDTLWVR
jgi:hypothetical protein